MGQLLCTGTTPNMLSFNHLVFLTTFVTCCVARQPNIGIFNVVKFPNDVCKGSGTMNGTCYTQEECSDKKGTASGSCADGFGVCCVISLSCGGTTYDNCTYLSQASTTTPGSGCEYTICPISTSVNRIRLDLTTFTIAGPVTLATADNDGTPTATVATQTSTVGHCATDRFSATGAPVICGENKGQHMILDTDGTACVKAVFSYGSATTSRTYEIHVTQYDSRNTMGGPTGCLQYYTSNTGTISSFNFGGAVQSSGGALGNPHLANQDYTVCIRNNADKCLICYAEIIGYASPAASQNSFGLSVTSTAKKQQADVGTNCKTDYIYIPNGTGGNTAAIRTTLIGTAIAANGLGRHCGRVLSSISAGAISTTVCSRVAPFSIGVFFDGTELYGSGAKKDVQNVNEASTHGTFGASGSSGFSIGFSQISCA